MALQQYITDTQALIRDTQGLFVPQTTLISHINEARVQLAQRTGCIRRLVVGQAPFGATAQPGIAIPGAMNPGQAPFAGFQTIPGVERYPYQGFGNVYLKQQYDGLRGICDVVEIAASWGGALRPVQDWMPWENFQAYCRANQILVTNWPSVWSVYNDGEDGEIWLFPVPQTASDMQWDCFCTPAPIYSGDDYDAIPHPWQNAVKYYAAGRCYEDSQRIGMAQLMYARFAENAGISRVAVDRGKTPTFYTLYP